MFEYRCFLLCMLGRFVILGSCWIGFGVGHICDSENRDCFFVWFCVAAIWGHPHPVHCLQAPGVRNDIVLRHSGCTKCNASSAEQATETAQAGYPFFDPQGIIEFTNMWTKWWFALAVFFLLALLLMFNKLLPFISCGLYLDCMFVSLDWYPSCASNPKPEYSSWQLKFCSSFCVSG